MEHYLSDRRIFTDLMYTYYTDYEPERLWVAVNEGQVVGFLAGCLDTRRREQIEARQVILRWLGRLLSGSYKVDRSLIHYGLRQAGVLLRREIPRVDLNAYPAHLHINLSEGSRGLGLGKQLMQAYLDQLKQAGVKGVYLQTTSKNVAAIGLYKRFEFILLESRLTHAWEGLLDETVENQAYGLNLCSG